MVAARSFTVNKFGENNYKRKSANDDLTDSFFLKQNSNPAGGRVRNIFSTILKNKKAANSGC
jgi:hypothetical protein